MEPRVQELEALVTELCAQRDDLYRDLETLCVSKDDRSSWSASNVLMKRVGESERRRDALAAENAKLQAEMASLKEDMEFVRASKRQVDAYCRDLKTQFDNVLKERMGPRRRRRSCDSVTTPNVQDEIENENPDRSDLADEKLREAMQRVAQLEAELMALAAVPTSQVASAEAEIQLMHRRIQTLEESLEKANEELEFAQDDARRSEHHVSLLLEQLEKSRQKKDDDKGSRRGLKKSHSLQKKLDRLSVDLTRAFSKMQLKDDALSETEAEIDSLRQRHKTDMTLVREACDMRLQEMKRLVAQKEETIQALQHSLELLELEKKKLLDHINRRDLGEVGSRRRDGHVESRQQRIDGMESKIAMLERSLYHATLKAEALEKQKKDALAKASAYKKRYALLKAQMSREEDDAGVPLLEHNLQLHNIATQWDEAVQGRPYSRPPSRRARSRTASLCSRHSQISLAQFTLFTLMMHGIRQRTA